MLFKKLLFILTLLGIFILGGCNLFGPAQNGTDLMDDQDTIDDEIEDEGIDGDDIEDVNEDEDNEDEEDNEEEVRAEGQAAGSYLAYSPEAFASAKDSKRVLFFHATWCPTCKEANTEFEAKTEEIPAGVVVFKTDYDKNAELKQKYGITYQHTFVYVDSSGNEIKKWNGGAVNELLANVK